MRELRLLDGTRQAVPSAGVVHLGWVWIECAAGEADWQAWRTAHADLAKLPADQVAE